MLNPGLKLAQFRTSLKKGVLENVFKWENKPVSHSIVSDSEV